MYKKNVQKGSEKMKRLVVDMEESLHTAIRIEALKQGRPAKEYVTELIEKDLKERNEKCRAEMN